MNTAGAPRSNYASWFVSAHDPEIRRAFWIRRTTQRVAAGPDTVTAWCTVFDARAATTTQTWTGHEVPVTMRAGRESFAGAARSPQGRTAWDLVVSAQEQPIRPLRPAVLYCLPLPRTKVEITVPFGHVAGQVDTGNAVWQVDRWPATVGHNWGSEHAEHWVWLHADHLGPVLWLDVVLARVRVGRALTPWLATGSMRLESGIVALGGLGRRVTVAAVSARHVEVSLPWRQGRLNLEADGAGAATTVVTYRNPPGGDRTVAHSATAGVRLTLERAHRVVAVARGLCSLEVGAPQR